MNSLLLLAAHMVGDFIMQTQWVADRKLHNLGVRAWHVTLYCLTFLPFMALTMVKPPFIQYPMLTFLALLWITHFITDSRRWASGDAWPPKPIVVDQTIHIATLAVLGSFFGF